MIRLPLFSVTILVVLVAVVSAQDKTATPPGPPLKKAVAEKITFSEVNVDGPYIAMTFDDGPHATNTAKLLDIAAKRHIKLTFFVLGQCVEQNPAVLQREVAEGHEIGNHSWSHPNLAKLSDEAVRSQLRRTDDLIVKTAGVMPKLMRPPYGELTRRQRIWVNHDFNYKVILWDVDPLDWKRPGPSVVASRIIAGARPGSIILSHDIHPPTIEAMPQVFDALLAKGFKFVTVSELLAMDKGGERPEVARTPQARLSPRGHFVPSSATVPEVQPAQSPATATSPH
ncbi:MAG TPA: polysaccharide deacetylase family protein [Candidatus Udaeobacter sp.]|jgi:peptidoglycan/xylan/chitin deacetylase (PgdA/CDA1 family)|nr:polysaccharide deacetylase family protein [Candidatus Udaeobacter sp.]